MATVRYRTPPELHLTLDLAPRPRAVRPLPMFDPGSFRACQLGFDEATAVAEASRCFRCDAVHRCPTVEVVAGRGPGDGPGRGRPTEAPIPAPVAFDGATPPAARQAGGER